MFSAKALSTAARRSTLRSLRLQGQDGGRRSMAGGHMPVPQSMKAKLWEGHPTANEGWENTIYFYYGVSFVAIVAILNLSPDTSIESWAQQEAQARLDLKAKGFTDFEFGKHYSDVENSGVSESWDKFTMRAIKPGEDDDDDEEEEDEEEEEGEEEDDDDDDDE